MTEPVKREYTKSYPNDKRALLDGHNYEMYNLDVMRKVFPRIINEVAVIQGRSQRKYQTRDIISIYFFLLSYIDGNFERKDGEINERFGAAFPSYEKITADLNIDHRRIRLLVDILVINGLISETRDHWEGTRRSKWYFVSFCPRISDDGYVVNDDGERIVPDYSAIDWR
ncbi:hypothetical protein [Halalkalibacter urbisdiaboli]|uniref:hypothetical protein n=1 Tax=Halalkalibacter urbisdiaboli TaxID=1960589 RepID=UPI000B44155B|nr:hypothetical protein [Halalkalibacter urbisdiaboli]